MVNYFAVNDGNRRRNGAFGLFWLVFLLQTPVFGQNPSHAAILDSLIQVHFGGTADAFSSRVQKPLFDSLPKLDSLPALQLTEWSLRVAARSLQTENQTEQLASQATRERLRRESLLADAQADSTLPAEQKKFAQQLVKEAKGVENQFIKLKKQASAATDLSLQTCAADSALQRKKLPKIWQQAAKLNGQIAQANQQLSDLTAKKFEKKQQPPAEQTSSQPVENQPVEPTPNTKTPTPLHAPTFAKYDPAQDVMLNPPVPPCDFLFDGRDEFAGTVRRELRREEFFRFTNDFMKPYLKDKPHILCEAYLAVSGGVTFLHLVFTINDPSARRSFGGFDQTSRTSLKLVDETTFPLVNVHADEGQTDDSGQVTTYHAQFPLDVGLLKHLQVAEVDKIRFGWKKGYEDYEVYNVDLLRRHLKCLKTNG